MNWAGQHDRARPPAEVKAIMTVQTLLLLAAAIAEFLATVDR